MTYFNELLKLIVLFTWMILGLQSLKVNADAIVIATDSITSPVEAGWQAMLAGNALDAVDAGCKEAEMDEAYASVGYGGNPDELGETTLDAMIIDGMTRAMGAVLGMRNVKHAIGVARAVMMYTKHSILVGQAATDFAEQMGFSLENLTTSSSADVWKDWVANDCQPNYWKNVNPDPDTSCGPYEPANETVSGRPMFDQVTNLNHDTIGVIAIDFDEHIAVGTSTNGLGLKIPGRVGDTPMVGAGGYVDREIGAAVAVGNGDYLVRFLPTLYTVEYMRQGFSPNEAASRALTNMLDYFPEATGSIAAMTIDGEVGGSCTNPGGTFGISIRRENASEPEVLYVPCVELELQKN